jgi:hypothetical protein
MASTASVTSTGVPTPTPTPSTLPTPSADPLAVLAGLYAPPFLVRLTVLPRSLGWRLELSEDDGASWSSLEAGKPGHASPALAIDAGATAIATWRSSRVEAGHAEVSFYFSQGKLERRKIESVDDLGEPIEIDGYAAQAEDGTWIEDTSPVVAIDKAKSRKGLKLR